MKCKNCGAENTGNVKYCYACGEQLATGGTVMERFPQYHFMPTSLVDFKGQRINYLWIFLSILVILTLLILVIVYFVNDDWREENTIFLFIAYWVVLGLLFRPKYFRFLSRRAKKHPLPTEFCDYVQNADKKVRYVFVVKNDKWGVYDKKRRSLQIPMEYDKLEWTSTVGVLLATKNDDKYRITINDEKLA